MATQDNHAKFGEMALKSLGLPSARNIPGLTDSQRDAYWALAQAMRFLKEGKALYGRFGERLPVEAALLREVWPALPPGTPDALSLPLWVERIREITATLIQTVEAPAPNRLLHYLYQVAQLTDVAALDNLPDNEVVALRLDTLWSAPPNASLLPVEQAVLILCMVKNGKRTTLLRVTLAKDANAGTFAIASPPDLGISRQAFFTPTGEPRGDFSPDDLNDILLAPVSADVLASWPAFLTALDERCTRLLGGGVVELPQRLFGNYASNLHAFLVDAEKLGSLGLSKILGPLLRRERVSPLLDAVLAGAPVRQPVSLRAARRDLFLGHMDERSGDGRIGFPLDPTQRLAVLTALSMGDVSAQPPIVPVNGPPGTGKTSFLRAVLASLWVRAAYEKAESPPLVVGTGATNKAVSNVIEAFSTVAGAEGGGIDGRWLYGLPSYGWLFPSKEARERFPSLMHLVFDETTRTAFTPDAGAADFRLTDMDSHRAGYIEHGIRALNLSGRTDWSIADIVSTLHLRISTNVDSLRSGQKTFKRCLSDLKDRWGPSRGTGKKIQDAIRQSDLLQAMQARHEANVLSLDAAVTAIEPCLALQHALEHGFVKLVRSVIGNWLYRNELAELERYSHAAKVAVGALGSHWPDAYEERKALFGTLSAELTAEHGKLEEARLILDAAQHLRRSLTRIRSAARDSLREVLGYLHVPASMPPGERHNVVYALQFARATGDKAEAAENMLWHRFDAAQDTLLRFPLFHLAARYWEGRWLLKQADEGKRLSNQERLSQLMMLGVIVVSTTHKLPSIGKDATIDLLVVDESGQCAPEVGAAMLSFANAALLVGDTKQLQPVAGLTESQSLHLANTLDLTLPPAFCAARGSAMALARFVTPFTDGVDGTGITLLYHYRCHPTIIGYCNDLLYGGKIRCVRPDKPTRSGLPPMSWVEVEGKPVQHGSSTANEDELREMARWIRESHRHLSESYEKPLDEVLAVITPLRAQAQKARTFLVEALSDVIAKDVLDRMTIGTVHALQGAERPVVAFSLVQQRSLGALFADRDGGFLMNVAVSRAKDVFIVFAGRDTLRGGPSDRPNMPAQERLPVGQLGAYMRKHGHRLYPRRLIVVEAKNKVSTIQKVLGTDCAVIASNGYLGNWSLLDNDTLAWSAPPPGFVADMKRHAGLLDELLVATDDDLAGELIGLQVADVAAEVLGDLPVRRMRFHSLEADQLRDALRVAGHRFDADMLAAALLREVMNALDRRRFQARLPTHPYVGEAERALVALVDELDRDQSMMIEALVEDATGRTLPAYLPENEAILSLPSAMDADNAAKVAADLIGMDANLIEHGNVVRVPPLYPPSTTQRILAASADELGIYPWETQEHMNAMYQSGTEVSQ